MNFKRRLLLASSLYLLIWISTLSVRTPPGDPVEVIGKVQEGGRLRIKGIYSSEESKSAFLVISRPLCEGMEVTANGQIIFKSGGESVVSSFNLSTIPIPLELKRGRNEIFAIFWGAEEAPQMRIVDSPWPYSTLSNILYTWAPMVLSPVIFALGIFHLYTVIVIPEKRIPYTFASISSMLAGIFLFRHYTLYHVSSGETFKLLMEISAISAMPMVIFYHASLESLLLDSKIRKFTIPVSLIASSLLPFIPLHREVISSFMPLVAAVLMFHLLVKSRRTSETVPPLVLMVASLHHFACSLLGRSGYPFLTFGITYSSLELLRLRIHSYMVHFRIAGLSRLDALTGLGNRRVLDEVDFSGCDCVVFMDVNDFKRVNDTLGHEKGDEILRELGEVVKRNLKGKDVAIRYGGDEFLLILRECDERCAKSIAEVIAKEFESRTAVTLSYGVAKGRNLGDAMKMADKRMYEMKESIKSLH